MEQENRERDALTNKVLTEGELVAQYIESDGWRWAKDKLTEKIMDLQSILNVSGTPEEIVLDLKSKRIAISTLMDWLRQVEGRAEQHKANINLSETLKEEVVIYQ